MIDEELGIDAEGVLAVVVGPSAGGPDGKSVVAVGGVLPVGEGGLEIGGIGDVSAEDFDRACADDGDGRGVIGGEVACGIEEDETREVGEFADDLIRLGRERGESGSKVWRGFHECLRMEGSR